MLSRNKTMVELTSWKSKRLKSLISMICCFCWCWIFSFLSISKLLFSTTYIKVSSPTSDAISKLQFLFLYILSTKNCVDEKVQHKQCYTISDNNHETYWSYWSGYDKFRNWIFSFKMQFLNNKNLKLMRRKKYGKSLNSIYNFFTFFFPQFNLPFISSSENYFGVVDGWYKMREKELLKIYCS